jgi:hypothetical protein
VSNAFIWVDPHGRILGSGVCDRIPKPIQSVKHCAWHAIDHTVKLIIEGEGHARFFVAPEASDARVLGKTADGLTIFYKYEIALTTPRPRFECGERIHVTHDAPCPVKLWVGSRPVLGKHSGKVHSTDGHHFSSQAAGRYAITVRDPRYWAEPLEVEACVIGEPSKKFDLDG